jgi:antitoxin (DNA-binding transcriptional repressor) of toxin-antitoxin stability system
MRKVGSRKFRSRMGQYPQAVRKGQTLIITARGKAVAQVAPAVEKGPAANTLEERLKELDAQGLIRLAKGRLREFRAVKSRGKPASQMIIEDRR